MPETPKLKRTVYWILLAISILFLFFLLNETRKVITGYATNFFSVGVKSTTKIRLTIFDYQVYLSLGNTTNISVEAENSGSTTYNEKIEIFIKNSTLGELAHYYDALTLLAPGERKFFRVIYLPPDYGVYYIQLRITYDETRRLETWGAFIVLTPPTFNQTPTTPTTTIPQFVVGAEGYGYTLSEEEVKKGFPAPAKKKSFLYKMDIESPKILEISKGETIVSYVKVKNVGNASLHSMGITTDTENISVDIFPKIILEQAPNTSSIFLLSVNVPLDIESNIYPLDLEVFSDEIKQKRTIYLNVTELSLKDLVYQMLLNYKFIIVELEDEIFKASQNGIKVSDIQTRLESIKIDMNIAENYYNSGKYWEAYEKLQRIRLDLQDLLMLFAIINIPKPVFLKASHIIILIGLLLLIILAIILYLFKKSREKLKRPKLLREASEESKMI